jgi:hypothetical protein
MHLQPHKKLYIDPVLYDPRIHSLKEVLTKRSKQNLMCDLHHEVSLQNKRMCPSTARVENMINISKLWFHIRIIINYFFLSFTLVITCN